MGYLQGGIPYLTCLLTEDSTEQPLLGSQLGLPFRSYFSYQNIACTNLCADSDNSSLIEIFQRFITHARNVSGDLFRSQLGVTGLCLIFFNMNGCIHIVHNQSFT